MALRKAQLMQAQDWPAVNPSRLRHRVQILQQSTTKTGLGSVLNSWSVIRSPWADIATTATKENFQAGEFTGEITHVVTVRWVAAPQILPGMRVVFTEASGMVHAYEIQTIDNVGLRNVLISLMCLEISGAQ